MLAPPVVRITLAFPLGHLTQRDLQVAKGAVCIHYTTMPAISSCSRARLVTTCSAQAKRPALLAGAWACAPAQHQQHVAAPKRRLLPTKPPTMARLGAGGHGVP